MKLIVCGKNESCGHPDPAALYLPRHRRRGVGRRQAAGARGGGRSPQRRANPGVDVPRSPRSRRWLGSLFVFRPYRLLVAAGVLLNAGCIAVWALTRITDVGGPFGSIEEVGFPGFARRPARGDRGHRWDRRPRRPQPDRAAPRRSRRHRRVPPGPRARGAGDGRNPHARRRALPRRRQRGGRGRRPAHAHRLRRCERACPRSHGPRNRRPGRSSRSTTLDSPPAERARRPTLLAYRAGDGVLP